MQFVASPNYSVGRGGKSIEFIVCQLSIWYNKVMKHITLGNGAEAIVDDDYIEQKPSLSWQFSSGYAKRQHQYTVDGKRIYRREYLHRTIMGAKNGEIVDHINGDTLDNRKTNLRLSNKVLNSLNSNKVFSSSGYRNVTWSNQAKKWQGTFRYLGKAIHCGFHSTAPAAYKAVQIKKKEVISWQ